MLCVFDTEQERNTAARHRTREDPERRTEEQVCLLGLCQLVLQF